MFAELKPLTQKFLQNKHLLLEFETLVRAFETQTRLIVYKLMCFSYNLLMQLTLDQVKHVAKLANLPLTDSEEEIFASMGLIPSTGQVVVSPEQVQPTGHCFAGQE